MTPSISARKLQDLRNGEKVVVFVHNDQQPRTELSPFPTRLLTHFAPRTRSEIRRVRLHSTLNLHNVQKDVVKYCLQWMYAGGVPCKTPNAVQLAEGNFSQVLDLFLFSKRYGIAPLEQRAVELIAKNMAAKPLLLQDLDAVYRRCSIFDEPRLIVAQGTKRWAKLEKAKKWYTPQIFEAEVTGTCRDAVAGLTALWNEIEAEKVPRLVPGVEKSGKGWKPKGQKQRARGKGTAKGGR